MSASLSSRQLYFRLLSYVRPYWKMLALGLFLSSVAAAMEPILPAMMKPLLDNGFAPKDSGQLADSLLHRAPWIAPLAVVGLMTARGLVTFCAGYAMSWVQIRLINDIRQQMFDHLVRLPMTFFEGTPSARTMTRLTNDVNNIGSAVTTAGVTLIRESLSIVGLLGWLLYLNWQLTLVTLSVAPFIAWVTKLVSKRLRGLSRAWLDGMGVMTQSLQEAILCQKVLKVFGGEEHESRRFARINDELRRNALRSAVASAAGSPMVHFFVSIALGIVVYMALLQSGQGETTVGSFVSFITGMLMLLAPLRALAGVNAPLQRGLAAAESVFLLLDTPQEDDPGQVDPGRVKGELVLREVSFSYPGSERPALSQVSFTVAPGQTVALVGSSGGGKSTLAALLPRFHRPDSGQILLDGIDLNDFRLLALRAQIAVVSQETLLFNDTVRANIAYGANANASDAEIEAAASAANALNFIRELPDGFETVIGENGCRLSGGQRQRLAIARAILKDAPILILDEATSALDNESERLVQEALDNLMKRRTTLVIAHRLSTIEAADQIIVLGQGRVLECGDHRQLLAANGAYAQLHRLQSVENS